MNRFRIREFLYETALVFPVWMMLALLTVPLMGEWAGVATFPAAIALSLYVRYSDGEEEGVHPQQMSLFHQDRVSL